MFVMAAFEHWTEILRCPNCGLTGVANLSEPSLVGTAIVIDNISEGFKAISSQYGDTFYCEGCDRAATEIEKGQPLQIPPRALRNRP
jgi:Zn finger protein HypA/HybF involved in hydrogenase expression